MRQISVARQVPKVAVFVTLLLAFSFFTATSIARLENVGFALLSSLRAERRVPSAIAMANDKGINTALYTNLESFLQPHRQGHLHST